MNVLALCAGIGGLELGLKIATNNAARTVCFCEGEAYCASVLRARMQDGHLDECPIWSDLKTFDAQPWRGVVDIITAGYPCQPFSAAGRRKGAEDPRHLWPFIASHVRAIRPAILFCENVPGHLSLGFDQVVQDLSGMGYLVEAGIFSAAEIGAPHLRKRLFFIAYTNRADLRDAANCGRDCAGQDTLQFEQHGVEGDVADTDREGRLQQSRTQREVGKWPSDCSKDVANTLNAKRRAECATGFTLGWENYGLHANGQQSAGGVTDGGEDVADAHCSRRRKRQRGQGWSIWYKAWGAQLERRSARVADADNPRLAFRESVSGNHAAQCAATERGGGGTASQDMANAHSIGCEQGRATEALQLRRHGADGGCTCGRDGGGPAERRLGRTSHGPALGLDRNPWADGWEDDIPRVTAGQPHRIDRLRALGNAVVPGVAQLAFTTLVYQALRTTDV